MSQMDDDYRKDYKNKDEIEKVRAAISNLLINGQIHLLPATQTALRTARDLLGEEADHIVRVWD